MADPNTVYKLAFAELEARLGGVPGIRDPEWLVISNNYSASFAEARETRLGEEARARADRLHEVQPRREPLSRTRLIAEPEAAVSEPEPSPVNPGPAETAIVPSRGPNGGLLARCVKCGRVWERPARKGRPAVKCEECR